MREKNKEGKKFQEKKRGGLSLKWCFAVYLPVFALPAVLGTAAIGFGTNDLQDWYRRICREDDVVYLLISYGQMVLIPVWIALCLFAAGALFYYRELRVPFRMLTEAARKISEEQLDFSLEYEKQNELGELCRAFEKMRLALYENNRRTWALLEERKRLNAAFSHEIRTPLTVLGGYVDLLEKYVTGENALQEAALPPEKQMQIFHRMKRNILRLEGYASQMSRIQKLEDVEPQRRNISCKDLALVLRETGELLCREKRFEFHGETDDERRLFLDAQCVMQVYENLVSNGARYASGSVRVFCQVKDGKLAICVEDDGNGFTGKMLERGMEPFLREETDDSASPDATDPAGHFGMGLYICRVLCEKCGGSLVLENRERGGAATAYFEINSQK